MKMSRQLTALAAAFRVLAAASVAVQTLPSMEGKTITIYSGVGPGGGYDAPKSIKDEAKRLLAAK